MTLFGISLASMLLFGMAHSADIADAPATEWVAVDAAGDINVHLYFFWTATCPHCQRAKPFVEALPAQYPWLTLHSHILDRENRDNVALYVDMARAVGKKAGSVPAFLFCGEMFTGYGDGESTGAFLVDSLKKCYDRAVATGGQFEPRSLAYRYR